MNVLNMGHVSTLTAVCHLKCHFNSKILRIYLFFQYLNGKKPCISWLTKWKYLQVDFWRVLRKEVMVGLDFRRKLSKMSILKSKPSGESWPTSKTLFFILARRMCQLKHTSMILMQRLKLRIVTFELLTLICDILGMSWSVICGQKIHSYFYQNNLCCIVLEGKKMLFEFFKKNLCGFFVHKWRSTIFPVCGFFVHNSQIGVKETEL